MVFVLAGVNLWVPRGGIPPLHAAETSSVQTTQAFYISDHLGSTRVLTDESGWEQARYGYYPYGEIYTPSPQGGEGGGEGRVSYLYTGQERDTETNLYDYGARYYDPKLGKFLSLDPAREGWNLYVYVGNNPLNYRDPTGKFRISEKVEDWLEENAPPLYEKYVDYVYGVDPKLYSYAYFEAPAGRFDDVTVTDVLESVVAYTEVGDLVTIARLGEPLGSPPEQLEWIERGENLAFAIVGIVGPGGSGKQYRIALGLKGSLPRHIKSLKAQGMKDIKTYWGVVFDSKFSREAGMKLSLRPGKKAFFSNMKKILENPNVEVHFTMNGFKVPEDMGAALAGKSSRTDFEYATIMRILEEDPAQVDRFHFHLNLGGGK